MVDNSSPGPARAVDARSTMIARLQAAATHDPRIVGMVEYGSGAEGRADEWSDLDLSLFVRDDSFNAFCRDWAAWAATFGPLLLAYTGHYRHPWTVYDGEPVPLRVDFDLHRESRLDDVLQEFTVPVSAAAMMLYDATGGRLTALVEQLIGRSWRLTDRDATFTRLCGDFWYFLLLVYSKLQRGEHWVARQLFHVEVMEQLLRLLRLEAGAIDRWDGAATAFGMEKTLLPERLSRLDGCIPVPGIDGLQRAMLAAARLGEEVCANIAAQHDSPWPRAVAERTLRLLSSASGT